MPQDITVRFYKTSTIHVAAPANPRRAGTDAHRKFTLYEDGMTIAQALEAGLNSADIRHDAERGYITIVPAEEQATT